MVDMRGVDATLEVIEALASGIGPRRPCSEAERQAAELLERWLAAQGVEAGLEDFSGYATFGLPYGIVLGAALAGGLLQRRGARAGDVLAMSSFAVAALEGDLRVTPLSRLVSRRPSVDLVGR